MYDRLEIILSLCKKRQNIFDPRPDWYRYSKFMEGRSRFIFRRLAVHHDHHDHWCDLYVIKSKTAKQEEGQLWTDSIYLLQMIQNWDFQGKHRKRRKKRILNDLYTEIEINLYKHFSSSTVRALRYKHSQNKS